MGIETPFFRSGSDCNLVFLIDAMIFPPAKKLSGKPVPVPPF
jgi:hypothetical protein